MNYMYEMLIPPNFNFNQKYVRIISAIQNYYQFQSQNNYIYPNVKKSIQH